MITALRATSETLRQVLLATLQSDPNLSLLFPPATVSLLTPDEMTSNGQTGVSLWLYRIVRDENRLNAPPQRVGFDRLRPPPLPLRLHYLVTPIISGDVGVPVPETEQHIMGAVLQTFYENPLVFGSLLSGDFAGTAVEIAVRLESLPLEEITRIWDSLERSYQLCVSYEVSVVEIDSSRPDSAGPPVVIALPEFGIATVGASA